MLLVLNHPVLKKEFGRNFAVEYPLDGFLDLKQRMVTIREN